MYCFSSCEESVLEIRKGQEIPQLVADESLVGTVYDWRIG